MTDRRQLLKTLAAASGVALLPRALRASGTPPLAGFPFKLGVASGFAAADSVVLWTRAVDKQQRHRIDVGALSRSPGTNRARPFHGSEPLLQLLRRANADRERIAPAAERDAPLGDRARRIGLKSMLPSGSASTISRDGRTWPSEQKVSRALTSSLIATARSF